MDAVLNTPLDTVGTLEVISMMLLLVAIPLLPLELWRRYRRGHLTWGSVREMAASASTLIPTVLAGSATVAFITALFAGASALTPWTIETGWASALACLILIDFLYYWDHRCGHRVRLYWAVSHSVHHSSPQFDQTTGLRISFVDGFLSPWFYTPALLAGFDPLLVVACFGIILSYQQWLHTETIGRLGWFDRWFNSPSNHRVHHGVQNPYLDRNYGAVLMVWDRMFGTWTPETEAPVYGLVHPINSANPLTVHIAEIRALIRDLRRAGDWSTRLQLLFHPPGTVPLTAGSNADAGSAL